MQVPDDMTNPHTNYISLLMNYGELSLEKIMAYECTYLGTNTRYAQDAHMLYVCIMNSLTLTAKDKVNIYKEQFHINGLPSGNLLLKVLI
jgi:hypothetical protein